MGRTVTSWGCAEFVRDAPHEVSGEGRPGRHRRDAGSRARKEMPEGCRVSVKSCLQAEMHAATRCKCQHVAAVSRHFLQVFFCWWAINTHIHLSKCVAPPRHSHIVHLTGTLRFSEPHWCWCRRRYLTSTATGWTARAKHSGKAFGGGTERWHGMQVDDTRHERQKQDGGLAATEGTSSFKREGER